MQDARQPVQAVQEFLDGIDWEMIEEAADVGAAALRFVRQHPWLLVAAGAALSAFGTYQMVAQRKAPVSGRKASRRYSATDLMAP